MLKKSLLSFAFCLLSLLPGFCQEQDSLIGQAIAAANLRERIYDYEGAIAEMDKAQFTNFFYPNLRIGGLYTSLGKYQSSLKYYRQAFLVERSSLEALEGMMNAYYLMMDYRQAKIMATKMLSISPYHKNANLVAAKLAMANLDFLEAEDRLQKILSVTPTDFQANVNMCYCMLGLKNNLKAEKILFMLKCLYPYAIEITSLEASLHP